MSLVEGSAQAGTPQAGSGPLPLDRLLRMVSLSHVNDPATTPIFPGDPEFVLETAATVPADGYYLQYVRQGDTPARTGARRRTSSSAAAPPTSSTRRTCSCPP